MCRVAWTLSEVHYLRINTVFSYAVDRIIFIPGILQTSYFGKWHLEDGAPVAPVRFCFSKYFKCMYHFALLLLSLLLLECFCG